MDTLKADLAEFQTAKDLKPILGSPGPCLSVYIPLSAASQNQSANANTLEWKQALRTLEPRLAQYGPEAKKLVETISNWDDIAPSGVARGKSVAVFRSPETFIVTRVGEQVRSRAEIAPHFHVRPLLPELTRAKAFYLLALSQKNVRMLRCTTRTAEEVPFPAGIATNFDAYMNTAKPDHVRDNRSSAGPGAGGSKGVMFGTDREMEDRDQHLSHFFGLIDRGVNEVLRGRSEPLVLCAVEYELPLYRSVNSYPHLAEESVQGAPNSLKSGEMHSRALDAMQRCYEKEVDNALAEYNHKVGGGASNRLKDVLTAAHDGRVLKLIVSDSLEQRGAFDESNYAIKGRETGTAGDEDLVNQAAVETILHAGQIFVAPNSKMPHGSPVAAVFRY